MVRVFSLAVAATMALTPALSAGCLWLCGPGSAMASAAAADHACHETPPPDLVIGGTEDCARHQELRESQPATTVRLAKVAPAVGAASASAGVVAGTAGMSLPVSPLGALAGSPPTPALNTVLRI